MEIAGQVAHGRRMEGLAVAQRDAVEITEPLAQLADVAGPLLAANSGRHSPPKSRKNNTASPLHPRRIVTANYATDHHHPA